MIEQEGGRGNMSAVADWLGVTSKQEGLDSREDAKPAKESLDINHEGHGGIRIIE